MVHDETMLPEDRHATASSCHNACAISAPEVTDAVNISKTILGPCVGSGAQLNWLPAAVRRADVAFGAAYESYIHGRHMQAMVKVSK